MKTLNLQKNIGESRFAACQRGARLIKISLRAAVAVSRFSYSVNGFFRGEFLSASPSQNNLMRCEIFRGKVARRKNSKPKNIPH
jgi:hypothetical protein